MKDNNTKFVATLILSQDGIDGDVLSKLKFDPLISEDDVDSETGMIEVPEVYELASIAAQAVLQAMGILDANGEVILDSEVEEVVDIEATGPGSDKLN